MSFLRGFWFCFYRYQLRGFGSALCGDGCSLCPFRGVNECAEKLDVETRGHAAGGLPLDAHHKPIRDFRFVGLDGSIEGPGRWAEAFCKPIDGAAMFAVDDDFAFPVENLDHAARDNGEGMALPFFGGVAMLKGFGGFPNEIIDEVAAT